MKLAYLVGGYPVPTERFVEKELLALENAGVEVELFALWKGEGEPKRAVTYLLERSPIRGLMCIPSLATSALWDEPAEHLPPLSVKTKVRNFWTTLSFCPACEKLAGELRRKGISLLHSHFANLPATVALVASRLGRIPFTFSAHASDIFVHRSLLKLKLREAKAVIACSQYTAELLRRLEPQAHITTVYHWVNVEKSVKAKSEGVLVLSAGRLVEKKGFSDLIRAVALLQSEGREVGCVIIGDGPLRQELEHEAKLYGVGVRFLGSLPHDSLIGWMRRASVFVLPCIVAKNGDRDVVPNVLLEAGACGVPLVSTPVGGIPEVIADGETGLLAEPHNPPELAERIARLLDNPEEARRLGVSCQERIRQVFSPVTNASRLIEFFREASGE